MFGERVNQSVNLDELWTELNEDLMTGRDESLEHIFKCWFGYIHNTTAQ